jgi:L-fucose mutarotase/ribose pyranase (RbsD/FucU family)
MSNVNKIVELILSDDEINQELGFMMAVSQGLKDEVLKESEKQFIKLLNGYNWTTSIDISGWIVKNYTFYKKQKIIYAYIEKCSEFRDLIIGNPLYISKANTISKLKDNE